MGENRNNGKEVIIIGIDAGTFNVIEPMVRKGELPNLEKIMKNGCWGNLESTIPPVTVPAWPSFATGSNPARHGLYEFMKRRPDEDYYRVVDASDMKGKTLWSVLSKYGKKCIVVNVPFTYPPEEINGLLISGSGTPDVESDYTYPKELKNILNKKKYKPFIPLRRKGSREEWIKTVYDIENKMKKITLELIDKEEWDFFIMVFVGTDKLEHRFWGYMDKDHIHHDKGLVKEYGSVIPDYYKDIDNFIGQLLRKFSDSTIFIMSDHGMDKYEYRFRINNLLREMGFLEIKTGAERISIGKLLRRMGITGTKLDVFFQKLKLKRIVRLVPEKYRRKIPYTEGISIREGDLDFNKTKIYSPIYCQIYMNLKGRDIHGIVEKDDYNQLRKQIYDILKNYKYNGKNVIDRIHFKEEIYNGEYLIEAPDIVYTTSNEFESVDALTKGSIMEPITEPSGHHRLEGIFLSYGPDINSGSNIKDAKIYDIAPTILHLMNVPIPEYMDGKVLKDIFKEESEVKEREISWEKTSERDKISTSIKQLKIKKRI